MYSDPQQRAHRYVKRFVLGVRLQAQLKGGGHLRTSTHARNMHIPVHAHISGCILAYVRTCKHIQRSHSGVQWWCMQYASFADQVRESGHCTVQFTPPTLMASRT